ncbi:alternative ribosome rescue aminoacyl-tRNA hydrolase ArfB [Polaribacter sp.]|jgi:ribosome-associated protein|uniref:alternative ribosome rescue aminoacyl-tRNA hydrolase ArfB n=1 Tax=Polaribacter sp. TaxID=1920175 RepID=UPI0040475534
MEKENIVKELKFKAIRSSGAGGQHVNKVSSKIELTFDLGNSEALNDDEKTLLKSKLSSKLTSENILILTVEETRSQHKNKELAIKKFVTLIVTNLKKPKKRTPTKPSKSVIKKRTETKLKKSVKKALRRKPDLD